MSRKGCISNPTTIQLLFEAAQALHDGTDFSNLRNDNNQQAARLISRFVDMVTFFCWWHLWFLVCAESQMFVAMNVFNISSVSLLQVDHGPELERHLTFLIECRGAFGSMNELKVFVFVVWFRYFFFAKICKQSFHYLKW